VRRYRDIAFTLLAFAGVVFLPFAYWQIKLTNEAVRSAIYPIRNAGVELQAASTDLKEVAKQAKIGSFQLRPELTALLQDLNSAEQQRARLVTMRSGESFARAGEEAALTAKAFREDVLPQLAALPQEIAKEIARAVDELSPLVTDGRAVLVEAKESVANINRFVESPEFVALLPEIRQVLINANATTAEIKTLAGELAQAAGKSESIAGQIEALLIDTRKSVQASERTLDAGTKTLGTIRKATWVSAIAAIGGLLR
jgi:ABC-type transporter Mla subunit MlaD